jgi:type I restriction enzyme S subunit
MSDFPSSWTKAKFEDLFDIAIGGTPSRNEPLYWDSEYKTSNFWVSIRDLKERVILNTAERISNLGIQKSNAKLVLKDTVIMSFKLSVGKVAIAGRDLYTNEAIAAFKPINEKAIDLSYFYQGLHSWDLLGDVDQAVKGVTLNKEKLRNIDAILPPLPEQQKIAQILTSVDEVIEKTQAQIDKLKDLKTAMMQELLTKGIGHLEFKDSPVGRIPVGWDVKLLDTMAKRGSGHTPNKLKPEYWNGNVKWISLTDSNKLDKLYIYDTAKKISQLGIENSSATPHPVGTVVMARDAGIGKSAITTSEMAVSQHFMAWVCGDKLDNYFLYYLLQYWKPQFENIGMGSTIKTIGLPYFKKLYIPVPKLCEQLKVSQALRSVDGKIFSLEKKNKAIKNTKKALMQDLLTGKVRVCVNE